jgi:hypothetical protein
MDINATLVPAMSPLTVKPIGEVKTVVFDPGHGGHDHGGRSAYGYEKDYNLDIVKRARRILEAKKVKVVQTRLSDAFVDLSERPEMIEDYDKPIFVSVHHPLWERTAVSEIVKITVMEMDTVVLNFLYLDASVMRDTMVRSNHTSSSRHIFLNILPFSLSFSFF